MFWDTVVVLSRMNSLGVFRVFVFLRTTVMAGRFAGRFYVLGLCLRTLRTGITAGWFADSFLLFASLGVFGVADHTSDESLSSIYEQGREVIHNPSFTQS